MENKVETLIKTITEKALIIWESNGIDVEPPPRQKVIQDFVNNLAKFVAYGYSLNLNPIHLIRNNYDVPVEWHPGYPPSFDKDKINMLKEGIHVFNPSWMSNSDNNFNTQIISYAEVYVLLKTKSEVYLSESVQIEDDTVI